MLNRLNLRLTHLLSAHGIRQDYAPIVEHIIFCRATNTKLKDLQKLQITASFGQSMHSEDKFYLTFKHISPDDAKQLLRYFNFLGDQTALYFYDEEKQHYIFEVNNEFACSTLFNDVETQFRLVLQDAPELLTYYAMKTSDVLAQISARDNEERAKRHIKADDACNTVNQLFDYLAAFPHDYQDNDLAQQFMPVCSKLKGAIGDYFMDPTLSAAVVAQYAQLNKIILANLQLRLDPQINSLMNSLSAYVKSISVKTAVLSFCYPNPKYVLKVHKNSKNSFKSLFDSATNSTFKPGEIIDHEARLSLKSSLKRAAS